jgi:NitT/TauT family transport system substrate-binding protein
MHLSRAHTLRLLAAPALIASTSLPAVAQGTLPVLRVASVVSDTFGEAYYADEKGFFKAAGINVELTTFANGGAVATAVASGAIDVGATNGLSLASAFLRNVPFVFLASGGLYNPSATQLCVADGAPIRSARDCNGKTFAISSLRGTEWLALQAWVDQNGGDSSTMKLLEIPYPEIAPATIRGTVSGGVITEPFLSAAKAAGGIRTIAAVYDVFGPKVMLSGWFTTTPWLKANPTLAKRFVDALYATARWANAHRDETATILGAHTKIDLAILKSMNRCPYGETLSTANLQSAYDLAFKYKVFDRSVDANDVIAKL